MALNRATKYRLVYTMLGFSNNIPLLKQLRVSFPTIEIPYLDYHEVAESTLDAFDSYIYIPDDDSADQIYGDLLRKAPKLAATVIGTITGQDALKMVDTSTESRRADSAINAYYKILSGPQRNLTVQLDRIEGDIAIVHYTILKESREMSVPLNNLAPTEAPPDVASGFTNLLEQNQAYGNKRAIVIDGSYVLYRSMFGYANTYTRAGSQFVGGAYGFYFTLLELKELYPEYEIHVVFDGWDEQKMLSNPEYKSGRISNSATFKKAFNENRDWIKRLIKAAGFYLYHPDDKEADDVIGSITGWLSRHGYQHIYIYSLDTDFRQLLSATVNQICPKQNFRGHTERFSHVEACAEFRISGLAAHKINWVRSLAGDTSDDIPSINIYYKSIGHSASVSILGSAHYIDIINNANTLEELKAVLLSSSDFAPFVTSGQFDRNLNLLTINTSIFDQYASLSMHKGEFSLDAIADLLQEFCFFKELEMLERNARILNSDW